MTAMQPDTLTAKETQRWSHVGALAALAMVLGYLETFVPIPIPGVKLGLANVAVLLALAQGDVWGACWVAVIKVLAAGLLFGSPITMAYSAVGTALSLALMVPLSRLRTMRLWMVSVIGALAHEAGQLLVAQALLGTPLVWYSAPLLMVAGCVTGAFCGIVAERALRKLADDAESASAPLADTPQTALQLGSTGGRIDPRLALLALIAFALVTLRLTSIVPLTCCLALSLCACLWAHVRWSDVARALKPVALICAITVVAQLISLPAQQAFLAAGISALRLLSLVGASLAFVKAQSQEELLAGVRWVLTPLQRLGISTAGPLLALDVAMQLLPLLASNLHMDGTSPASLSQLIADAYRLASRIPH